MQRKGLTATSREGPQVRAILGTNWARHSPCLILSLSRCESACNGRNKLAQRLTTASTHSGPSTTPTGVTSPWTSRFRQTGSSPKLLTRGCRPRGYRPRHRVPCRPAAQRNGLIGLAGRRHPVGVPFAGRGLTVRLELEELRVLANADMDSHPPFACLLVGQPTLRRRKTPPLSPPSTSGSHLVTP